MRRRTLAGSLGGTLALTLLLSFTLPGAAQAGDPRGSQREAAGKAALAHAQAVLAGGSTGDVSMALRDLFRTADGLSGADLAHARALLARPTDPDDFFYNGDGVTDHSECGTYVCVHWTEEGVNASTQAFAEESLQIVEGIHERYVAAGYRSPVPDQGQGGDTKTDIYLADLGGTVGAYGYCTSDVDSEGQPTWVDGWTIAPYCVFDNDFAEFPWRSPEENLEVTAAHEYFHAVQYAYDANDDVWAYETTATWAEDELYDDINDNLQYLPYGQMGDPDAAQSYQGEGTLVPLDYSGYPYGNWTWIRYLTEKYPTAQAGLPTLVRSFWQGLDTTGGAPARYSLQSLDRTLAQRGTSTAQEYAGFSTANRTPAQSYAEGDTYPTPALAFGPIALSRKEATSTQTLTLDHLTSGTGAFTPADKGAALKVRVDMAAPRTGSAAIALVLFKDGTAHRVPIALNNSGTGQVQVPFSSATVSRVEVTLVNGSSAMKDCGTDPYFSFSCAGFGEQDGRLATVRVQSVS
jgi:hypothetical protein